MASVNLYKESVFRKGMTLVELLIAMSIMIMLTAVVFSVYQLNLRYTTQQQAVIDQTQNLRTAMYNVNRDIRMAGSGMRLLGAPVVNIYIGDQADPSFQDGSGWFKYSGAKSIGVRPIYGINGGADKTDSISLFYTLSEGAPFIGILKEPYNPLSSDSINLTEAVKDGTLEKGEMLAVVDGTMAVILQAGLINFDEIIIGSRFKPAENLPGSYSFSKGSKVYNVKDVCLVTYYVDKAHNRLMAKYYDSTTDTKNLDDNDKKSVVMADNIEDLQVLYGLNNPGGGSLNFVNAINDNIFDDGRWVRGVRVAMVAKAEKKTGVASKGSPLQVMDHTSVGAADGFTRRLMVEDVQLRNF